MTHRGLFIGAFLLFCAGLSCGHPPEAPVQQRAWSVAELKALQGSTREEIQSLLGKPMGLYTFDSKGRWHYPNVAVREEGEAEPQRRAVLIYFSQFGEHRATIIDIIDRWESDKE